MKRSILLSPHISRLFSALFWLLLLGLFGFNLYTQYTLETDTFGALSILVHPFSSELHMNAAQTLWREGYKEEAKHEAKLAQILGASDQITKTLSDWESEPEKLQSAYDTWKRITLEKPDYADAFLQAAFAAYQLGKINEAKRLINEAITLNPNSEMIKKFFSLLQ